MWAICRNECVGKAWVGVRCDVHNSVPPLQAFQEHSANDGGVEITHFYSVQQYA